MARKREEKTPPPKGLLSPQLAANPAPFTQTDEQMKAMQDWWLQNEANKQSATMQSQFNRVNESGPYGSANYVTNEDGSVSRNYSMNPWEQTKYSQEAWLDMEKNRAAGQASNNLGAYSTPFQYQGLMALPGVDMASRKGYEEQIYGAQKRRLDQDFAEREARIAQDAANRGLTIGSKGWQNLYDQLGRDRSEAYTTAQESAFGLAGSEMSNMFNAALTGRQQQIGEQNYLRDKPFQEYANLRTPFQSSVNQPQYSGVAQIGFGAPQVGEASQGYQQMTNQMSLANKGSSGGGGGGRSSGGGGGGLDLNAPVNYTPPSTAAPKSRGVNVQNRRGLMALTR